MSFRQASASIVSEKGVCTPLPFAGRKWRCSAVRNALDFLALGVADRDGG